MMQFSCFEQDFDVLLMWWIPDSTAGQFVEAEEDTVPITVDMEDIAAEEGHLDAPTI